MHIGYIYCSILISIQKLLEIYLTLSLLFELTVKVKIVKYNFHEYIPYKHITTKDIFFFTYIYIFSNINYYIKHMYGKWYVEILKHGFFYEQNVSQCEN